jgi:hypothetical protein
MGRFESSLRSLPAAVRYGRMTTSRHLFRFSLIGFLTALTTLCIWLGRRTEIATREGRSLEHLSTRADFSYIDEFDPETFPHGLDQTPRPWEPSNWHDTLFGGQRVAGVHFRPRSLVKSDDLDALARLTSLRGLTISTHVFDDRSLEQLRGLANLEYLDLSWTIIDDDGLKVIAAFAALQSLDLAYTHVEGKGLQHLVGLADLKRLNLEHTTVADEDVLVLEHLYNLRRLNLRTTRVTETGVQRLRDKLPSCQIVWRRNGRRSVWQEVHPTVLSR